MTLDVLVVDDSSVMRAMIVRTLGMAGLPLGQIHQAANGIEATAVLHRHSIQLALIDVNMPLMGGEELVDRIRRDPRTARMAVVMVTTEEGTPRAERLKARGAAFVHKPFTPETLGETVRAITMH